MRLEVKLDPAAEETTVTVTAAALTDEVRSLLASLEGRAEVRLTGFREGTAVPLTPGEVLRFFAQDKEVYAQTAGETFLLRSRLYELEASLDPRTFVRISHSEIVNLKKVTALDLTLTGTIKMTLTGGTVTYTSRRYVKKIKEALGLGRRQ